MASLTAAVIDADWVVRRRTGFGLRRDRLDPGAADPEAPATFETCVIRLPSVLAVRLGAVAAEIAQAQPGQYACPAETLHVTVCGPVHLGSKRAVAEALSDLAELVPSLTGGRLRVVRIGIGDTSVFAALEPDDPGFRRVRRQLAERWAVPGRGGVVGAVAARLLWANLVRFTEPPLERPAGGGRQGPSSPSRRLRARGDRARQHEPRDVRETDDGPRPDRDPSRS